MNHTCYYSPRAYIIPVFILFCIQPVDFEMENCMKKILKNLKYDYVSFRQGKVWLNPCKVVCNDWCMTCCHWPVETNKTSMFEFMPILTLIRSF